MLVPLLLLKVFQRLVYLFWEEVGGWKSSIRVRLKLGVIVLAATRRLHSGSGHASVPGESYTLPLAVDTRPGVAALAATAHTRHYPPNSGKVILASPAQRKGPVSSPHRDRRKVWASEHTFGYKSCNRCSPLYTEAGPATSALSNSLCTRLQLLQMPTHMRSTCDTGTLTCGKHCHNHNNRNNRNNRNNNNNSNRSVFLSRHRTVYTSSAALAVPSEPPGFAQWDGGNPRPLTTAALRCHLQVPLQRLQLLGEGATYQPFHGLTSA